MTLDTNERTTRNRSLLFGVIAVQLHFITPADLAQASLRWTAEQDQSLGDALVEMGLLQPDECKVILELLDLHVRKYRDNPGASLQAFGGERAVNESFGASVVFKGAEEEGTLCYGEVDDGTLVGPPQSLGAESDHTLTNASGPILGARLDDAEHITLEHPGRYTIQGEFGRGGIGRVLIAFDEHIGREVALKELLSEVGGGSDPPQSPIRQTAAATARFLREARITGQLEHPSIIPVYEIAKRRDGSTYYTMKLVRGKTLAQKIKEIRKQGGGLPARMQLLNHFLNLCQAMAYAHSKGVIHRDLKPANVMVGEFGETVVLDWGLAKVKGRTDERADELEKGLELIKSPGADETMKGMAIGTPSYMPPEQAEGRIDEVDERSDVWSLGAICYEILADRPPFIGDTAWEVVGKVIKEEVMPLSRLEPNAPPELAALVLRCLSKDPARRYSSSAELTTDVAAFTSGGLVSAYQYSMTALAKRWLKKYRTIVTTASVALLILLIFGAWSFNRIRQERNIARGERDAAKANLAESYLGMGQMAEKNMEWGRAEVLYGTALDTSDSLKARVGLNYARLQPLISAALLHSLEGHTGPVRTICFSPDGKILASTSEDGTIKLWDPVSGKLLHSLEGSWGGTDILCFSPDGKVLASKGDYYTIKLWDPVSGNLIQSLGGPHSLEAHTDVVWTIGFSPDGKVLASGSEDKTIKLWDPASGKLILTLEGNTYPISTLCFSPDGKVLASGSGYSQSGSASGSEDNPGNKTIKLWDPVSGKLLHSLEGHTHEVNTLCFSPDGKVLASGSGGDNIKLWDPANGKLLHSLESGSVFTLCFSPDGKVLASGHKLWDPVTGKLLLSLEEHTAVNTLCFSPDGAMLASGGYDDNTIKLWDRWSGALLLSLERHSARVTTLCFSPDGTMLASGSEDSTIKLWKPVSRRLIQSLIAGTLSVNILCFSPDSTMLASGNEDSTILLWDPVSGKLLHSLEGHTDRVTTLSFSPDGKVLASGSGEDPFGNGGHDHTIKLWDPVSGKLLRSLELHDGGVDTLGFSPDGKVLASGSGDSNVLLWDPVNGKSIQSLIGHTGPVTTLGFSPDGKVLASGSRDSTILLWDPVSGKLIHSLESHESMVNWVNLLCFSPDGKMLASGNLDHTLELWDPVSGKLLHSLEGHTNSVDTLCFSPDGKVLASGSLDYTVKLWDPVSGKLLHSLDDHTNTVLTLGFSPDGKVLASGGGDSVIKLWDPVSGKLLHSLERSFCGTDILCFSPDGKVLAWGNSNVITLWPMLDEIMHGDPKKLLNQAEQETGLKVIGMDVYPWNPETGKVSEKPLARPF